jgi:hypothetical protein
VRWSLTVTKAWPFRQGHARPTQHGVTDAWIKAPLVEEADQRLRGPAASGHLPSVTRDAASGTSRPGSAGVSVKIARVLSDLFVRRSVRPKAQTTEVRNDCVPTSLSSGPSATRSARKQCPECSPHRWTPELDQLLAWTVMCAKGERLSVGDLGKQGPTSAAQFTPECRLTAPGADRLTIFTCAARASVRGACDAGSSGKDGAHEGPFVAKHAATVVPDAVRLDEVGICAEQRAVLLVGGEAGEAEQREGPIAGALGGRK